MMTRQPTQPTAKQCLNKIMDTVRRIGMNYYEHAEFDNMFKIVLAAIESSEPTKTDTVAEKE